MDEHKRIAERERGSRAKQLLEDELLVGALDAIERSYLKAWRDSKPAEKEGREDIWVMLKILGEFRAALEHHVITGKLATEDLIKNGKLTLAA